MPEILMPDGIRFDIERWIHLIGLMCHPENEQDRRSFVASCNTIVLEGYYDAIQMRFSREAFTNLEAELFSRYGGRRALLRPAATKALDTDSYPIREWRTVALILEGILTIEAYHVERLGRGSVNKLVFLIDNLPAALEYPGNKTHIQSCWTKYKSVAHLAIALVIHMDKEENFDTEDGMMKFYSLALSFQEAICSFIPQTRTTPLLERTNLWTIPKYWNLEMADINGVLEPFSEETLLILDKYKAPA